MEMKYENWKISWFQNPRDFKGIRWHEINYPSDTTVNFEDDGDGHSKYVFAPRTRDNRFIKVAKATVFPTACLSLAEIMGFLTIAYTILDKFSPLVILGSLYGIIFLICGGWWYNQHEIPKEDRTS